MGVARNVIKGLKEKLLGKYGEKIVSNLADTSSDAPNRFAQPKRDAYDQLVKEGKIGDTRPDR